ncbi:MAG: ATP synthase F1 subunit gamma [Acidobacteria bacterium RIFCSPLOWO2_12_FULL_54_10]|nr:MAG: ATP synthase F1 subunit gamma [Acidobacteria bacterium RIFCSPLOWO2_12_FULL_54_10]
MPSLIDMRRRIRSVRSTQQITKAMKMISAARLRRAQERAFEARPYANLLQEVLESLVARVESPRHPLLVRRTEERIRVLVLSGDRGLCGAFNTNVIRATERFLEEHRSQQMELALIGRKARDYFRRRTTSIHQEFVNIFSHLDFHHAREISADVISSYAESNTDAVYLIYNEFKSMLSQRVVVKRLLPLAGFQPPPERAAAFLKVDYIYEQPPQEIYDSLLPKYVEILTFRALLESAAAEHAARMTAMDSATNNAGEMIESLTLTMNRVRQATITKELIEVVSGAAVQ